MASSIGPYRSFVVGLVRVALWEDFDEGRPNAVTVERSRPGLHNQPNYSPILELRDISKAILALKQAYDFLEHANTLDPDDDESISSHTIPERIP